MSALPHRCVPAGVRAVVFDAVGTLLQLDPPAADVYAVFAKRFGSRLEAAEIRRRFGAAFAAQESLDFANGHRTDEAREIGRWQCIVAEVIDDIDDPQRCFQALYEHFALPDSWRCDPDARVIGDLKARGLVVGMASNFDHRLRPIVAGLPELAGLEHLLISSEIGFKKPAVAFFSRVCQTLALTPSEILFVGDDFSNDFAGARSAGLHALLFDPRRRSVLPPEECLDRLSDLVDPGQRGAQRVDR